MNEQTSTAERFAEEMSSVVSSYEDDYYREIMADHVRQQYVASEGTGCYEIEAHGPVPVGTWVTWKDGSETCLGWDGDVPLRLVHRWINHS
jgi:hypothetical protein